MNTEATEIAGRQRVVVDTDEFRVIEETIAALGKDKSLFSRGNILVRALRHERPEDDFGVRRPRGSITVKPVPQPNLRDRMTRYAEFVQAIAKAGLNPVHPPDWLVKGVDARGDWPGIRPLRGISDAPILRQDGTLWQTPGYDVRSGVLYEPANGTRFEPIDPDVTAEDAEAALDRLMEVICDFRFETDAHRAAWIAGLLTSLSRFAFDGPAPLFLVDANIRGAGKGLLCQTIGRIVLGRELPASSYSHNSEEMRKRITSIAIGGDSMILLDNLVGKFGNDALDRALTSTMWKDRELGLNRDVELPLIPTWFATGNNVQVAADAMRRIIHIRLEVLEERPEHRSDFKHKRLLEWITANRYSLLRDALTILAAYIRAGKPDQNLRPLGSFEGWSELVRQAVVWVGLPDPCDTQEGLAEAADTEETLLGQLLDAWEGFNGLGQVSIQQLVARLYPEDRQYAPRTPEADAIRAALEAITECPSGKTPSARAIGTWLRGFRNRPVDGLYLTNPHTPDDAAHTPKAKRTKHGVLWMLAKKGVCDASTSRHTPNIHCVNPN